MKRTREFEDDTPAVAKRPRLEVVAESLLLAVPPEMRGEIRLYLTRCERARLAQVCRAMTAEDGAQVAFIWPPGFVNYFSSAAWHPDREVLRVLGLQFMGRLADVGVVDWPEFPLLSVTMDRVVGGCWMIEGWWAHPTPPMETLVYNDEDGLIVVYLADSDTHDTLAAATPSVLEAHHAWVRQRVAHR